MSLANLQLRTATITYNEQDIVLRGLSANDIAGLVLSQMSSIEQLFDIVEAHGVKSATDLADANVAQIAQQVLSQVPGFVAAVIAYSANEPQYADNVLHLPAPVQVQAMKHVAELTFNDEAGFREFVGNVVAALRSAKGVVPQASSNQHEKIGSLNGGSASAPPSHS